MTQQQRGVAYPFYREVEARRIQMGIGKRELAARTGVARTTIAKLGSGSRPPTARTVHALAEAVDIEHAEAEMLAGLTPGGGIIRTASQHQSVANLRDAITYCSALSTEQRDMLSLIVQTTLTANAATTSLAA